MKLIKITLIMLTLSGCATTPLPSEQPLPNQQPQPKEESIWQQMERWFRIQG